LHKVRSEKKSKEAELTSLQEYVANLHKECDWILENFIARKEARASEIDQMIKAKIVLASADETTPEE